jgi:hypothetical protein
MQIVRGRAIALFVIHFPRGNKREKKRDGQNARPV